MVFQVLLKQFNSNTSMVASYLPKRAFVGLIVCFVCGVCLAFRLQLIQTRLTSSGQQLGKFRGFEKTLELSVEGNQVNTPISFAKIGTKSTKPRPAVRWTKTMVRYFCQLSEIRAVTIA